MDDANTMAKAFFGFASIAALTWFFSTRPRLFMRVFVPRDQLFGAGRQILRRAEFRHGMRVIAGLQFGAACVFGLFWLWETYA